MKVTPVRMLLSRAFGVVMGSPVAPLVAEVEPLSVIAL